MTPGDLDLAPDAEHEVLAVDLAAIVLDRAEGVEVALARSEGRASSSRSAGRAH